MEKSIKSKISKKSENKNKKHQNCQIREGLDKIFYIKRSDSPRIDIVANIKKTTFKNSYKNPRMIQQLNQKL
jgi:hypothetical protein